MLDFMIIGLPRSATTWAANWLYTDRTHCVHDPLDRLHYSEWDYQLTRPRRLSGVSCTSIWRFPAFVNAHPARKVILHRDLVEVNQSLTAIGMPELEADSADRLTSLKGLHCPWSALFDPVGAESIWNYLTGLPFDMERHHELKLIEMQPQFAGLSVRPDLVRQLVAEVQAAVK